MKSKIIVGWSVFGLLAVLLAPVVAFAAQDDSLDWEHRGIQTFSGPVTLCNGAGTLTIGSTLLTITAAQLNALTNAAMGATLLPGYIIVGNSSSNETGMAITGDITFSSAGASAIGARKVTAAMLPVATPTQILVGNASSNLMAVTGSGVITNNSSGVFAFAVGGAITTNFFYSGVAGTTTNRMIYRAQGDGLLLLSITTP